MSTPSVRPQPAVLTGRARTAAREKRTAVPQKAAESAVAALLLTQDGVIARRQVEDAGLRAHVVQKKLRGKDWVPIHPGVYVNHSGSPTWRQRVWAALLDAYPAAVADTSVLHFGRGPIHIAIERGRTVKPRRGITVHRRAGFSSAVDWSQSPPRLRAEEAALDVADAAPTDHEAIAALSDAVGSRRTTVELLRATVKSRKRMRRRTLVTSVLDDIANGTCSVLEHAFLTDVELAHGLPTPERQAPTTVGRKGFRDTEYIAYGVIVELDGVLGHTDRTSRDRDLERDLDAAVGTNRITVRLGSGQVLKRPCTTARKLAVLFQTRGWPGTFQRCANCRRY